MADSSNASSTENLLSDDESDTEQKQLEQFGSPDHYLNDDNIRESKISVASWCTKERFLNHCSRKRVLSAAILAMLATLTLSLSFSVTSLSYVIELQHRVEKLETQCTFNKIHDQLLQLNSSFARAENRDSESSEIAHLRMMIKEANDKISILESMLNTINASLTVDSANSDTNSALQTSLRLVKEDVELTKVQLRNLSMQQVNVQHEYEAIRSDFYATRDATDQNMTWLYELIRQVESNHSLILDKHSGFLGEAATNASVLAWQINETSTLVRMHAQTIGGIRSNVSTVANSVTLLHSLLTRDVQNLNKRIDHHVDWTQSSFNRQSQKLARLDRQVRQVSEQLSSGTVRVASFGFLFLCAVSFIFTD